MLKVHNIPGDMETPKNLFFILALQHEPVQLVQPLQHFPPLLRQKNNLVIIVVQPVAYHVIFQQIALNPVELVQIGSALPQRIKKNDLLGSTIWKRIQYLQRQREAALPVEAKKGRSVLLDFVQIHVRQCIIRLRRLITFFI